MADLDLDGLRPFADMFMNGKQLTCAERSELFRIAQGLRSRESAEVAGLAVGTVRFRRKRMYRKLGVASANQILASLLRLTTQQLASATAPCAEAVIR